MLTTHKNYDVTIVPSQTTYFEDRPNWLVEMPGRNKLFIDVNQFQPLDSSFFLVQAIYEREELEQAIPADQYAYQKGESEVLLLLKSANYIIRILDNQGIILKKWEENVE